MQQPPNYFGNSYPNGPTMSQQQGSYPESSPYMGSKDYPQPQRASNNDNPPPANQNTVDNDPSLQVFPLEGMEEREITIYATFPDSVKWHDKVFTGYLLSRSNEALTILDKETKKFVSIVSVYINYVETKSKEISYPY